MILFYLEFSWEITCVRIILLGGGNLFWEPLDRMVQHFINFTSVLQV